MKNAVLGMAQKRDPALAEWIDSHVSFPGTMVDRIVPAATEASLAEITQELGVEDPCAISCEPFIQWVVEDNFVAGRPAWEVAGVQMVQDVLPWEQMKLRMLNGSHSFLAYLGYLAGYAHINECMEDTAFREAARRLMLNEQAPTLRIKDVDLTAYADSLLERFANPALQHRTGKLQWTEARNCRSACWMGSASILNVKPRGRCWPGRCRLDPLRQRYRRAWRRD